MLNINIQPTEKLMKVHDYWINGQRWNWEALNDILPDYLKNKLEALMLSEEENTEDIICWGSSTIGKFTIRSAYDIKTSRYDLPKDNVWKCIWKLKVPSRIRTFIWLTCHKKRMTNTERVKRGFTTVVLALYAIRD